MHFKDKKTLRQEAAEFHYTLDKGAYRFQIINITIIKASEDQSQHLVE